MILIYGAYGYTGELIAREANERGLEFAVGGRNGTKTRGLGVELGVESRVFPAKDAQSHLEDVDVLLNCAGPFLRTHASIVDACLATGTHYLDITGELPVFEALVERDREAERAGVCLLPGVGFDVVPTDCLAAHLHERLPGATHLELGVDAPTSFSGGTLASVIGLADAGGTIRRDGRIESTPIAHRSRTIDFGAGTRNAVSIPLADVSTAYFTTGIENITGYLAVPSHVGVGMRLADPLAPLLGFEPVKSTLQTLARTLVDGPSERFRTTEQVFVWGEASNEDDAVTSRLVTPEPYTLTVDSATTAIERFDDDGDVPAGYQTPASAFGPDFVLGLQRVDGFHDDSVSHRR